MVRFLGTFEIIYPQKGGVMICVIDMLQFEDKPYLQQSIILLDLC